jgi:hypothetical protein
MNEYREGLLSRICLALGCFYAPYAWLLLMAYPWNAYRWHWIKMWPVMPGLLVHASQTIHSQPDWVGYLAMGGVTSVIITSIILLVRRNWQTAIVVSIVGGLLSSVNSWIAYGLFWF